MQGGHTFTLGGVSMDNTADVTLTGATANESVWLISFNCWRCKWRWIC